MFSPSIISTLFVASLLGLNAAAPVAVRNVKILIQVTSTGAGAVPTYIAIPVAAQPLVEVISPPAHFLHHPTTSLVPEEAKVRTNFELIVPVPVLQLVSGSVNTCKRSAIPSDGTTNSESGSGC